MRRFLLKGVPSLFMDLRPLCWWVSVFLRVYKGGKGRLLTWLALAPGWLLASRGPAQAAATPFLNMTPPGYPSCALCPASDPYAPTSLPPPAPPRDPAKAAALETLFTTFNASLAAKGCFPPLTPQPAGSTPSGAIAGSEKQEQAAHVWVLMFLALLQDFTG